MDICFNPALSDSERRTLAYRGDVVVLPPNAATLALVGFARSLIEASFEPYDPKYAHEKIDVMSAVNTLTKLKPHFIHHPETKKLLQRVLLLFGCDPDQTYQDVPRMRVAYPKDYLTTGIAYAHHAHRDTWYSAPPCQLNWWMPLYDFEAEQGMAFHPRYWGHAVKNGSSSFNYYAWNAEGRKNAGKHVKSDTRVQPHAEEELELEPAIRLVVPTGGIILFSADQLHSTVPNETGVARWSLDFRTVNSEDLGSRRGAIVDSASTGTSLRDFRRVRDFEPMPDALVEMYDSGEQGGGESVFVPREKAPAPLDVKAIA